MAITTYKITATAVKNDNYFKKAVQNELAEIVQNVLQETDDEYLIGHFYVEDMGLEHYGKQYEQAWWIEQWTWDLHIYCLDDLDEPALEALKTNLYELVQAKTIKIQDTLETFEYDKTSNFGYFIKVL